MCEAICKFERTTADWATMSFSQARNPRHRTVNTQTSGLGGTQMRVADLAQARLVLSEIILKEAKSGSDLILRVGFLHSGNCTSTKGIFVTG